MIHIECINYSYLKSVFKVGSKSNAYKWNVLHLRCKDNYSTNFKYMKELMMRVVGARTYESGKHIIPYVNGINARARFFL